MSLTQAAAMLRQYSKIDRKPIDSEADEKNNKFGTWSYLNMYDALYDKFSQNKNFNINMWHNSIKHGEQDTYIALLDINRDRDMSQQFYDPGYYDYEAMMLEMYKSTADASNSVERFRDVYDYNKDKWVQESLGEMSDYAYIEYQLDQVHMQRAAELQLELEQARKDNMGWFAKTGHTILATLAELGEGLLSALTSVVDFIVAPFYATGAAIGGQNWGDAYVDYYGDKGLTALEKKGVREALDEYERTHTYIRNIDGSHTTVGKYLAGISNSIGMMVPAIVLNYFTGGAYGALTMGVFYTSIYGNNMYENATNPLTKDSPAWLKITNATVKTAVEAVIEWGLNKVLGGTIQNQMIGLTGKNIAGQATKQMAKGAGLKYLLKSAGQEGLEEFLQDFSTNLVDQFTGMIYEGYEKTGVTFQTLLDSFFIGAAASLVMSGGAITRSRVQDSIVQGRIDKGKSVKNDSRIFIEGEGGTLEQLKGSRKMAFTAMLSDIKAATDKLSKEKVNVNKNLDLAQELFAGVNTLAQFYQSFDIERIKNAELLLDRVSKAEQKMIDAFRQDNTRAGNILTDSTIAAIQHDNIQAEQRANLNEFARKISSEFNSMVGEASLRYSVRMAEAAEKAADKLAEGGVTEVLSANNADGDRHVKDPDITVLEGMLTTEAKKKGTKEANTQSKKNIENKVAELAQDYEWVFTTDGHVAIEQDGFLFVSEAWLENYSTSEIYEFLAQNKILDAILADKALAPLIKDLKAFDKKFTGQKNVNGERALMDLLFNPSVYQAFLLSNNGKNVHKFKDFIFRLHDLIKLTANNTKLKKKQQNYLNKIYNQIKDNMRRPTIKAILNWNMDPQLIGADSILTQADKAYIAKHQIRKRLAAQAARGPVSSQYRRLAEQIIRDGKLNQNEIDLINKGLAENASNHEKLVAISLLNSADQNIDTANKIAAITKYNAREIVELGAELLAMEGKVDDSLQARNDVGEIVNEILMLTEQIVKYSPNVTNEVRELYKKTENELVGMVDAATIIARAKELLPQLTKTVGEIASKAQFYSEGLDSMGVFSIPVSAFGDNNAPDAVQHRADMIKLFKTMYGIEPELLVQNKLYDMSLESLKKIAQAMETLGVEQGDYATFVVRQLEALLGNDYVVTTRIENDVVVGYDIVQKIQAQELLIEELAIDDVYAAEELFLDYFTFDEMGRSDVMPVSEFLKVKLTNSEGLDALSDWNVACITDTEQKWAGEARISDKLIVINLAVSEDVMHTFVHEVNHAIQFAYGMGLGFNPKTVLQMPDFMLHILHTYPEVVAYNLRTNGFGTEAWMLEQSIRSNLVKNTSLSNIPDGFLRTIAHTGYSLVQGELWAEHHMHNGRLVKGYQYLGNDYIVSPDGKHKFKIGDKPTSVQPSSLEKNTTPPKSSTRKKVELNKFERTFKNIIETRALGYIENDSTTDTYHSYLSKISTIELTQQIINKGLATSTQVRATINDIILDPETFLSEQMLSQITDKSEAGVYNFLKSWFEQNTESISVDRDGTTHEYLFVDNNAFNELQVTPIKLENGEFTIDKFYQTKKLEELGVPTNIKVVVGNEIEATETRIDKENPEGAIFIKTVDATTEAELSHMLNHEFRHLLQYYNDFEAGFTPDFLVTDELLQDIKAHAPQIFKIKQLKGIDQKRIAQLFVYYMTGGEQNAYGIKSQLLQTKPVYVTTEAGKPTIFMPWYNAETGEGRYATEFLAQRADDNEFKPIPRVNKKHKYKEATIDDISAEKPKKSYRYTNDRHFTREFAKGTNLEFFLKKGKRGQMAPELQNFIIATTGNLDKLPKPLAYAIEKGKLTKQSLYKWFREADVKSIDQYTFDLVNKHIFKNDVIKNMKELDELTTMDITLWWAAAIVLKKQGMDDAYFMKKNGVAKFAEFMKTLEGTDLQRKIEKYAADKFDWYYVESNNPNSKTGVRRVSITPSQATVDYMRVFAMQYFDGTLAGAFYTARTMRNIIRNFQERSDISLDAPIGEDNTTSLKDMLSETKLERDDKNIGNSILAMYELEVLNKNTDDMIYELGIAAKAHFERKALKQAAQKLQGKTNAEKKKIIDASVKQAVLQYVRKLSEMSADDVAIRYQQIHDAEMTGLESRVDITDTTTSYKPRVNIVANLKRYTTNIIKAITEGRAQYKLLPADIQAMFEKTTAVDEKGKKHEVWTAKPEVWSVGKGAIKSKGSVDHDFTQIIANETRLKQVYSDIKAGFYSTQELMQRATKAERELAKRLKKEATKELAKRKGIKTGNTIETTFEVKHRTKNKAKRSETPTSFTIVSQHDMPACLHTIFSTSFTELADTKVQFASKDQDGKLYEKGDAEFESRVEHEVNTWAAFYEVNRKELAHLTRDEAFQIIDFISHGSTTLDGPANKLAAFQVFLVGYIVDAARKNTHNWNFSDAETQLVETLYEQLASAHGSGLNAVSQMLKVVNPFKRVEQRYFEDYGITPEQLEPVEKIVEQLQDAKSLEARKELTVELSKELAELEKAMADFKKEKGGWGKNWYHKLKSARYSFMLSSPTTWIRNIISNIAQLTLNNASDAIGKMVFARKGYRPDQWNLANAKVSEEVRTFIDTEIKSSPLFELLYDSNTKYSDGHKLKVATEQKALFVQMITTAVEQKFAAEHRFDSETANIMAKFVNMMISDKRFIKYVTNRYLGKILTLEVANGKVDLSNGLSHEVLTLFAESVILANREYMHKRSWAIDMIDKLKENHKLAYEVINWWQPFINSSWNWFAESLNYTPFGLAKSIINMCKLEQQVTKMAERRAKGELVPDTRVTEYLARRNVGKGIIGTLFTVFGLILGLTGVLRIDEDDDKFYMVIGDARIDISSIFGTSSILIGASLSQIGKEDLGTIMKSATDSLLEGFFLKDMWERHQYDRGFYEFLLTETESLLRSFTPQFVQLIVRAFNNEQIRYSSGMKGMWERWLNSFVITQPFGERKIDPFTGEVKTKYAIPFLGELLKSGIFGPRIFWEEISEEERLAAEYGINKNELTGELTINGVKKQLDRGEVNKKYGELNKKSLAQIKTQKHLVQMPDGSYKTLSWDKMSDKQRTNVINRTMTNNAEIAKIWYWTQQLNKKYYGNASLWQTLRRLGITRNVYKGDKGFVE